MTEAKIIPRSVWYGLEGEGYDNIAQELLSENPLHRKWVSIYAIYKYDCSNNPHQHYDFIHAAKSSRYAVIIFTIPTDTLENSDGLDDRDITITNFSEFDSEKELNEFLANHAINPSLFTPPWRCDYPL